MAETPPTPSTNPNVLSTHRELLESLLSFLAVTTHHILYLRRIYPPASFVATRAYNYTVRQNRHPDVCDWINDAVAAVQDQMERNTVEKIGICIFECEKHQVLERWTFDLQAFPTIDKRDQDITLETPDEDLLSENINLTDLEATFRATLSRISTSASRLRLLPEGDGAPECSFTVTMEVKDGRERPVGRIDTLERQWVAAEPKPFDKQDRKVEHSAKDRKDHQGKTHPVRRMEAGEMRLEVWVEESAVKFSYPSSQLTSSQRDAGSEKFDPERGYELEPPNINRKLGGGMSTDYQVGG